MTRAEVLAADREIVFACGHAVTPALYARRVVDDPKWMKFWAEQSMPSSIGAVAPCPECKGRTTQVVVGIRALVELPVQQGRLS